MPRNVTYSGSEGVLRALWFTRIDGDAPHPTPGDFRRACDQGLIVGTNPQTTGAGEERP